MILVDRDVVRREAEPIPWTRRSERSAGGRPGLAQRRGPRDVDRRDVGSRRHTACRCPRRVDGRQPPRSGRGLRGRGAAGLRLSTPARCAIDGSGWQVMRPDPSADPRCGRAAARRTPAAPGPATVHAYAASEVSVTDDRRTPPARVVETHISVLVFVGDRVYKLRKPVHFDFLDFTDRAVREADCRREVELNRRLAPDVYLGVADIVMDGEAIDHMVVMRALPDERRLATLVRAGGDVDGWLARWRDPRRVPCGCRRSAAISEAGTRARPCGPHGTPISGDPSLRRHHPRPGGGPGDPQLGRPLVAGHRALLEDRIASGRVCDGHGDLQAEDMFCLDDGVRILDCIEFSDELRYGDVCADVAFLAMDLERLGRPDAAERFVLQYEAQAGERLPAAAAAPLHRPAGLRAGQGGLLAGRAGEEDATATPGDCTRWPSGTPRRSRQVLVLVGGLPGTGKSTLAAGLAAETGWALLRSDEIRRELQPSPGDRPNRRRPARGATPRPRSAPSTTRCSSGAAGTSTRASRSSSTRRGSMPVSVRRRCARLPIPAASSWSSAAPARSRWPTAGSPSGRAATRTPPRRRHRCGP